MHVWADEQVSLICQKALFTYKYHHHDQLDKIEGLDTRRKPDGHFIVSKEEQEEVFGKLNNEASIKKESTIRIQPDEKAGHQNFEKPNSENGSDEEEVSELSIIPTPSREKHLIEVENLKWQIEYERKFPQDMNWMLEDKVS